MANSRKNPDTAYTIAFFGPTPKKLEAVKQNFLSDLIAEMEENQIAPPSHHLKVLKFYMDTLSFFRSLGYDISHAEEVYNSARSKYLGW